MKNLKLFFAFVFLVLFFSCSSGYKTDSGTELEFEMVGYFKADNNLRYYTFYVSTSEQFKNDSISEDILQVVKKHGGEQMNTAGEITTSFYYFDKDRVPDITFSSNADDALNIVYENKPDIAVWIMPNGQINAFIKPE